MKILGSPIDYRTLPDCRFKSLLARYEEIQFAQTTPCVIVNGLPIQFDFDEKKIGVNFSGGVDSTFLLYILCKVITEFKLETKIVPISVIRFWETSIYTEAAKDNILRYLNDKFPGILELPQFGFLPTAYELTPMEKLHFSDPEIAHYQNKELHQWKSDIYYFFMFNRWVARRHGLKVSYGGTTTNPPKDAQVRETPEFRSQEAVKLSNLKGPRRPNTYSGIPLAFIDPFEYVEKHWVVAQYKNFGIEDLFALTRSCENLDEHGCNHCFHCDEKKWALENCDIFVLK